MKRIVLALLPLLALGAATGCKAKERRADWFTAGRTKWQLESMYGKSPIEGTKITLLIRSDGRMSGSGGVNPYFASYRLGDEGEIETWRVTSMQQRSTDWGGVLQQEDTYFALLEGIDGYSLGTHDLELTSGGAVVARFVPVL